MSDILEAYAKIAEERGLLNNAITKVAEKQDEALDSAELLYGITPEDSSKKHIMEQAHPETVVMMRSYDAMNGVLENAIERQNMMTYIALKDPNGIVVQRRYVKASNDLMNATIKAAFTVQNEDENLMRLADSCSERLVKKALAPLLVAKVGLVVAALGAIYYFGYTSKETINVAQNAQDALDKLNEEDSVGEFFVDENLNKKSYYSYLNKFLTDIRDKALAFYNVRDSLVSNNMEELVEKSSSPEGAKALAQITAYKKELQIALKKLPEINKNIRMVHENQSGDAFYKKVYWYDWQQLLDKLGLWYGGDSFSGKGGLYSAIQRELQTLGASDVAAKKQKGLIENTVKKMQEINPFASKETKPNETKVEASNQADIKKIASKSGIMTLDNLQMKYEDLFRDDGRR